MQFGVFYLHQVPKPWHEDDERRVFERALEQAEFLDTAGFHSFWVVEHHFLEEYSHSSAPEVFLAALSQRTKNLRLGHGIMHTPPSINHPVRQAERIATLDIVSGGRVEWGTGEGSAAAELDAFGIAADAKREMWEEGLRVALRCMTEVPFTGFAGDHVSLAPRNVVPKPIQKPHPPVWIACTRRETIRLAAQRGIGALSFAFFDPEEAKSWVDEYYTTLAAEAVPIGDAVNANLACVTGFMCHRDEGEAIQRGAEGSNFLGYSLGHYYVFGRHRPGNTDIWADYQKRRKGAGYDPEAVQAAAANQDRLGAKVVEAGTSGLRGAIGTPEQVREYFRRYEDCGVDLLILSAAAGRNQHEHIMESYELIAKEVMPEFLERDQKIQRDKQRRLAPIIEQVMARKPASDHPPLDPDYLIPALPRQTADDSDSDKFNNWLDDYRDKIIRGTDVTRRLG